MRCSTCWNRDPGHSFQVSGPPLTCAPISPIPTVSPAPSPQPVSVRQRSLWVRLLVAATSTSALIATVALVAAAAIVPPIGARRTARETALREVEAQVRGDERIVAQAFASQRRWTDMWRESFGVVVATDQRLLYVGTPPTPLLNPRDDGPAELLVASYPYDAAFSLEPRTVFGGRGRGLVLRTPTAQVDFLVDDAAWANAERVARASADARGIVSRDIQQLDAASRGPAPRAEEFVPYVVRRGETLTGLAQRFRTTPDVLRQLNKLTTDNIQAGQRLRVPKPDNPA